MNHNRELPGLLWLPNRKIGWFLKCFKRPFWYSNVYFSCIFQFQFVRRQNRERLSPQCVKKTVKFGGERNGVGRITSVGLGLIVRFHGNINTSVYKELFSAACSSIFTQRENWNSSIYTRQRALLQSESCVKFSWRRRNSCYEFTTTEPRYKSYRECMENHRRESSEQKSSKYW